MLPRRIHSAVHPLFAGDALARVVKASPADVWVSPEAVVVHPGEDLQGDIIEPEGGNWEPFQQAGCLTNFEHGVHIGYGEVTLKSIPLADGTRANVPVGVTTFFQSAADLRGQRLPRYDARGNVVGSYTVDECVRTAAQVAPLVADGTLNGVSVEFRPAKTPGAFVELGPSPLLDRPACHFRNYDVLGWAAACQMPVNPNARYVLPDDSPHRPRAEKAFKLVYEANDTLDVVRKSLTPLANLLRHPTRTTVAMNTHGQQQNKGLFGGGASKFPKKKKGVLKKLGAGLLAAGAVAGSIALARNPRVRSAVGSAVGGMKRGIGSAVARHMPTPPAGGSGTFGQHDPNNRARKPWFGRKAIDPDEQTPAPETPVDDTPEHDDTDTHAELPEGMTHTPATCFQISQSLLDVAQMGEDLLAHSEHPEAKAKAADIIARARALAEEAKTLGDDTHAELSGAEKPADDAEKEPLKTDESGAIESKSFGAWRPVRLTAADLGPPVTKKGKAPTPTAEQGLSLADQKYLLDEVKRLRSQQPQR